MAYEWDSQKAASNLRKHGVDFADAVSALEDQSARTIQNSEDPEERYITLGLDAFARVLVVVYTWRGRNIRIISARKATGREQLQYEEGL